MPNHPARRPTGFLAAIKGDDPTAAELQTIQEGAVIERLRRSTERDLGLLEMADVEALTVRGLAGAGNLAHHAVAEISADPAAAGGVSRLLNAGNAGLEQALRRYLDRA